MCSHLSSFLHVFMQACFYVFPKSRDFLRSGSAWLSLCNCVSLRVWRLVTRPVVNEGLRYLAMFGKQGGGLGCNQGSGLNPRQDEHERNADFLQCLNRDRKSTRLNSSHLG